MLYEFDHQQCGKIEIKDSPSPAARDSRDLGGAFEDDLMARIARRDERALEALMKLYQPVLRSAVERIVNNSVEAADVVEEVFINIWNQAANYDPGKGKPLAWIMTVARRRGIDRVRRRQSYENMEARFGIAVPYPGNDATSREVDEQAANADTANIFQKLIPKLPQGQREVINLTYYRGLSQREIARETGTPLGTVKTRLELGIKKLRVAIRSMGTCQDWL